MESLSLQTASAYINNLLLARGLLRGGLKINFASPDKDEGGVEATMGRIMGLVNEMILRQDRDAGQRESLSLTIRNLRGEAIQQRADSDRLQTKHMDAQRRLALAEATERTNKEQIKRAEQVIKGLKEDINRMRGLVGQTRAQCANEIRKREKFIEGLKKHVGDGGRTRGSGKAAAAVVNVTAGVTIEEDVPKISSTDESGYDLRMETNEFLTELAKNLSEENENLAGLLRKTVNTLTALSGFAKEEEELDDPTLERIDFRYESLATDVDSIIEHLREILTNPSFVPLEEVQVRETEIMRLREGWDKMEAKWREVLKMIVHGNKPVANNPQTINLEELGMGMKLSPTKGEDLEEASRGTELDINEAKHQVDDCNQAEHQVDNYNEEDHQVDDYLPADHQIDEYGQALVDGSEIPITSDSTQAQEAASDEGSSCDELQIDEVQHTQKHMSRGESPEMQQPVLETPQRERATGDRKNDFTTIVEENTWDFAEFDESPSVSKNEKFPKSSNTNYLEPTGPTSGIKPSGASRLPRPTSAIQQQSPLTVASIAAKLAAAEREADAARVRAKLKAAKLSTTTSTELKPQVGKREFRDPVKNNDTASPNKKRKGTMERGERASRRSTPSRWELESPILGNTAVSPEKDSKS